MTYFSGENQRKCSAVIRMIIIQVLIAAGLMFFGMQVAETKTTGTQAELGEAANKLYGGGNYKEALALYGELLERKDGDPMQVGGYLSMAVNCLNNLNRQNETDSLRERVIERHKDNWRLLWIAAQSYQHANHSGYMVAGKFERGGHRGGGNYMNSLERDRVRALQLMVQAMHVSDKEINRSPLGGFYQSFAQMWLQNRFSQQVSWELQALTDITKLPDYEPGYAHGGGRTRGAAVDADGNPVFYHIPRSFEDAKNDGERWRWCLMKAVEMNPELERHVKWTCAVFFQQQFGVQTMVDDSGWGRMQQAEEGDESGIYAVHTLKDNESIARLAVGIKRFQLPDEFNHIILLKALAAAPGAYQINALQTLAAIYENRRIYSKAAQYWQKIIDLPDQADRTYTEAREKLSQIKDNQGQFEPVMTQPEGRGATVEFRFRNASRVDFKAYAVKVPKLLDDVKAYIRKRPNKMDWQKIDIGNIGWRLVGNDEKKYIGEKTAEWSMNLKPRKNHWDRRVTVDTPLKKAGAYLVTAKLAGGNTSRIIIWINDTVIVHKPLSNKNLYFVADAVTGAPLPHLNVEFFGYDHRHVKHNQYRTDIRNFAEYTDPEGQVILDGKEQPDSFRWLVTATDKEGRLAYLGFNNVWHSNWYDREYNRTKVFTITDRPVYRPGQTVKFKQWVRRAQYDQEDKSAYADTNMSIEIRNPKGDRIFQKTYVSDAYGGFDGEFKIPADATLGEYGISNTNYGYGAGFRVEEYKKPEFEVTLEAPKEPVMLGETVTAEIKAKYYFGEPVKQGKIKYKVLRYNHSSQWFPTARWDWFYNPGYWWFAYDYVWYPGWSQWGCVSPRPWWVHRLEPPPEVVLEREVPVPEDGILKVDIDTRPAREIHGDTDHRYEITAEVTDLSRRTIVGKGTVLVARRPFKVYSWVDRGHYRTGDTVRAEFSAQTLDNRPVSGVGRLVLYRIKYDKEMQPVERPVEQWHLDTDAQGRAHQQIQAARPGQYRLSYTVTDQKDHAIEGGYVFTVRGKGFDGHQYRFDPIELVTDKREYRPGESVQLQINTNRKESTVALFLRPANGVYPPPKIIHIKGKSCIEKIPVTKKDMPNFFIEAFTIADGRLHSTTREVIVPPEKRILNLEVEPSAAEYKPGQKANIRLKLTDAEGRPFVGSTVVTMYDKALEYISGGSNVPEIKAFFWKWRRSHSEVTGSSLNRTFTNLLKKGEPAMQDLGAFGHMVADMEKTWGDGRGEVREELGDMVKATRQVLERKMMKSAAPMSAAPSAVMEADALSIGTAGGIDSAGEPEAMVQPVVRTNFADAAFWSANVTTDENGYAEIRLTMPDNLTGWKVKAWAMGHGTKVGEAETIVTTKKNLMVRLQAPRFFIEKDEVVLSANVHNYLEQKKKVQAVLEMEGGCLELIKDDAGRSIRIPAGGEARVDWRVKAVKEGTAVIRMQALTDEESDAMELSFPVYVHGADKMVSWSGYIRPENASGAITIDVPEERRLDSAVLEIRYSPTLAGAMVDALPYLTDYPYGCTEQTLNRFLPTVITQNILRSMGLDLQEIEKKRTNLNAQEIGDDQERAKQWKKQDHTFDAKGRWVEKNPVFDEQEVVRMVKTGVRALTEMQLSDGGWGWFSGYREVSQPHTTAYVVHGLQIAQANDTALVPGVLERGVDWLKNYQSEQVRLLKLHDRDKNKGKSRADNLDAFVYMVLVDAKNANRDMGDYLFRDRVHLSVYAKAMAGMAFHAAGRMEPRDALIRNIEQYLVRDDENQTAYLNLDNGYYWWYWYGSEYEAQAYYLKLLARTGRVHDWQAPYLVKYLLNNRKHAHYWNSTRDTALVIEAFADYLKATQEHQPDLALTILMDGKPLQEVKINSGNLFQYDNKFVLAGKDVKTGRHKIELRKKGKGPLYFNAYLSYFSLEDFITKAGLEVKVQRRVYRLKPVDKTIKVAGSHGQAVDQKVEKYERILLDNDAVLKSGDLVEIELVIESKNDYEYLIFEDFKAAGFESVDVRSGYTGNEMGAYVEFRDNRTAFFARTLARGKHSVSYRLRAEIPGRYSALPAKGYAMYAPELKGNSDEIKLRVED